jgi:hypothetical protein
VDESDITLNEDVETTEEKKPEQAPDWASSMADTMRALADRVTAPPPVANPGLTKDQIDDINARITKGIVDGNPLGTLAPFAHQVAKETVDSSMTPIIAEAVDSFVDRFRSKKKEDAEDRGQVSLYRAVSKQFEKELEGEDLAGLVSRPRAERERVLNRAWKAATGEVLEKRVATKTEARPAGSSANGGSGSNGSNANNNNSGSSYRLSEREKNQLYRSMSKEAADKYIAEIESALVGVSE